MKINKIIENLSLHDATFFKLEPTVKKAKGSRVTDINGKSYIDLTSGINFANIGHSNNHVIKSVIKTLKNSLVNTHVLPTNLKSIYIDKLCKFVSSGLDKVVLTSSGSEAVETALKCIFLYGQKIKKRKNIVISFETNWHGRTMAAAQLCSAKKIKDPWIGSFSKQFKHIEFPYPEITNELNSKSFFYNSLKRLKKINFKKDVTAFFIEGFQGWTSAFYPKIYMKELKKFAKKNKILLCFDEVQSGFGRTGEKFSFNHFKIKPDLICIAKGMASGFPISATMMNNNVYRNIKHRKGGLGSTYCGNAVSVSAALATLEIFEKQNIIKKAKAKINFFQSYVKDLKSKFPNLIRKVYGIGMVASLHMIKLEHNDMIRDFALKNNVLLLKNPNVKICPPLNINMKDLKSSLDVVSKALESL